jgi:hypothetical protein
MKSTTKQIKLDKTKLFGFNQAGSGKLDSENKSIKPVIGSKTVGAKVPPPVE